jgi:hypothetical protein
MIINLSAVLAVVNRAISRRDSALYVRLGGTGF